MTAQTAVQNFEQRYTLYQHIALYCAIAAGIFLVITVLLFLILRIPQVMGELTGRTARKAVQEMIEKNPGSGRLQRTGKAVEKKKKSSTTNKKASKTENEEKKKRSYHDLVGENDTPVRLVSQDDMPTPAVIHPRAKTEDTDLDQTTLLQQETDGETTILMQTEQMETSVLSLEGEDTVPTGKLSASAETFKVVRSIVEIHTDEVI